MNTEIFSTKQEMGKAAAAHGILKLQSALSTKGSASFIVATGASQFETLAELAQADLPWNKMTGFHLDEYVGLPISHDASFRNYLWERFVSKLTRPLKAFHFLDGEGDVENECRRLSALIEETTIDVAFVGIGEGGFALEQDDRFSSRRIHRAPDLSRCILPEVPLGTFREQARASARGLSLS